MNDAKSVYYNCDALFDDFQTHSVQRITVAYVTVSLTLITRPKPIQAKQTFTKNT